jgi:hypothetical protein
MASLKAKILGARNKPNKVVLNPIMCQQDPIGNLYGLNDTMNDMKYYTCFKVVLSFGFSKK